MQLALLQILPPKNALSFKKKLSVAFVCSVFALRSWKTVALRNGESKRAQVEERTERQEERESVDPAKTELAGKVS